MTEPSAEKLPHMRGSLTIVRIVAPKPDRMLAAVKLLLSYQPEPKGKPS